MFVVLVDDKTGWPTGCIVLFLATFADGECAPIVEPPPILCKLDKGDMTLCRGENPTADFPATTLLLLTDPG